MIRDVYDEGRLFLRPDFMGWTPSPGIYQAYFSIFRRCGLDVIAAESDTGMMGSTWRTSSWR